MPTAISLSSEDRYRESADMCVEVSPRKKEDYNNGREYYAMHGRRLISTPKSGEETTDRSFLEWHNQNIHKAG
jgi:putative restriction endonuclease